MLAADPCVLAAVCVHLSGRTDWLAARHRPMYDAYRDGRQPPFGELSALVDDVLAAMSDDGGRSPSVPADDVMDEILAVLTGERLSELYRQRAVQDLRAELSRHDSPSPPVPSSPVVVVVGAGLAGLSMARQLRNAGVSFTVLERNADVGGVWLDNVYPDCGLDSPPSLYSLANDRHDGWSRTDPKRDEVLAYARGYADRHDLRQYIRFGSEVRTMTFDGARMCWNLELVCDGRPESMTVDVIVSAVGTLNRPKLPDIPGLSSFTGRAMHTAQWPADIDLRDSRVGVVGNGSSGVQVVRPLSEQCQALTIFQRSPAWIAPKPETAGPISDEFAWLVRHVPFYATWQRIGLYWTAGDREFGTLAFDPTWLGRGPSESSDRLRGDLEAYIRDQLPDRPDLVEKLTPDYPPYAKRVVVDNEWYATVARPHVELVTDPISQVTARGVQTADGRHHDLDVIVFATGFHGDRFLWPMEVRGRSGRTLAEVAGGDDELRAYLGVTIPDFPNLFSIQGPNSSIGHGGAATWVIDCQTAYIAACVSAMADEGILAMECRADVCEDYNRRLDEGLTRMVWSHAGVESRYRNAAGRIVANHPWTLMQFWDMTRRLDLSDYVLEYLTRVADRRSCG